MEVLDDYCNVKARANGGAGGDSTAVRYPLRCKTGMVDGWGDHTSDPSSFRWVHSSDELCLSAGALKARYKMSFADAFIADTALHANGVLVHKDPEFDALKSILPMKSLPYKCGRTGTTGS